MNSSVFPIEPYTFNVVRRFKVIPFFPIWEIYFEEDPAFRMSGSIDEVVSLVHKLNAAWNLGYASGVLAERFNGQ
jgi:hypothetical protein